MEGADQQQVAGVAADAVEERVDAQVLAAIERLCARQHAESRHHAGSPREDHARHPQLAGDPRRMQRPAAAKGDHGAAAIVEAAFGGPCAVQVAHEQALALGLGGALGGWLVHAYGPSGLFAWCATAALLWWRRPRG